MVTLRLATADPNTTWIAIGSVGTFVLAIATFALVGLTKGLASQAEATARASQEQVNVMRDVAASEAAAIQDQIAAAVAQGEAIERAARAELQPIVFAHSTGPARRGPLSAIDLEIGAGEIAFLHKLANEGTGIALDVHHGVEVGGVDYAVGGGMAIRVLRAGEAVPPPTTLTTGTTIVRSFQTVVPENDLPADWEAGVQTYWARFENVFGELFETRVPSDRLQSAAFMQVSEALSGASSVPVLTITSQPTPLHPADRRPPPHPASEASIYKIIACMRDFRKFRRDRRARPEDWTATDSKEGDSQPTRAEETTNPTEETRR